MVEQPPDGWVGHSVTRVKWNEMKSFKLFKTGGTVDNKVYSPRDALCILGLFVRAAMRIDEKGDGFACARRRIFGYSRSAATATERSSGA